MVQFRAFRELRGETPENVTKLSQIQNEPKTNPNEPNFLEAKTDSKPKNEDSRQIYENLFMQNEPNLLFENSEHYEEMLFEPDIRKDV